MKTTDLSEKIRILLENNFDKLYEHNRFLQIAKAIMKQEKQPKKYNNIRQYMNSTLLAAKKTGNLALGKKGRSTFRRLQRNPLTNKNITPTEKKK